MTGTACKGVGSKVAESEVCFGGAGEGDQERAPGHVLHVWLLRAGHRHRQGGLKQPWIALSLDSIRRFQVNTPGTTPVPAHCVYHPVLTNSDPLQ